MCPTSTIIDVNTTSQAADNLILLFPGENAYTQFPAVTGTTCLQYTSDTATNVTSFILPFNADVGDLPDFPNTLRWGPKDLLIPWPGHCAQAQTVQPPSQV